MILSRIPEHQKYQERAVIEVVVHCFLPISIGSLLSTSNGQNGQLGDLKYVKIADHTEIIEPQNQGIEKKGDELNVAQDTVSSNFCIFVFLIQDLLSGTQRKNLGKSCLR